MVVGSSRRRLREASGEAAGEAALPGDAGPLDGAALRNALRRWRLLHRVKQAHAAERLGVAQSTISRWEDGTLAIDPAAARRIEALVAARLSDAADAALKRLIEESPRAIHLVCDASHRLLAFSPQRGASFGVAGAALLGRSLWRYSTPELMAAEAALAARGWHDALAPAPVEFDTGDNGATLVPIRPSRCRWTRMTLSDGAKARLVETLAVTG